MEALRPAYRKVAVLEPSPSSGEEVPRVLFCEMCFESRGVVLHLIGIMLVTGCRSDIITQKYL